MSENCAPGRPPPAVNLSCHASECYGTNLSAEVHTKFVAQLEDEDQRSRERFIQHFRATYGTDHPMPPYWMITELMTFGSLLTLYKGSPTHIKKAIASRFGVGDNVLQSWLGALNVVRNICAHHSRLVRRVCPEQARERAGLGELGRNSSDKIRGRKLSLKVVTNQSKKAVASGAQSSWCFSLRRRLCDRIHQAPIKEIIADGAEGRGGAFRRIRDQMLDHGLEPSAR